VSKRLTADCRIVRHPLIAPLRRAFRLGHEFGLAVIKTGKPKAWMAAGLAADPKYRSTFNPGRRAV
jgi:hypothetical protein